jgi:hypothetical protein
MWLYLLNKRNPQNVGHQFPILWIGRRKNDLRDVEI